MNAKMRLLVLTVIVGLSLFDVACDVAVGVGVAVPYGNPWGNPYGGPYGGGAVVIGGGPVVRY
jgi:hypothetical protein